MKYYGVFIWIQIYININIYQIFSLPKCSVFTASRFVVPLPYLCVATKDDDMEENLI